LIVIVEKNTSNQSVITDRENVVVVVVMSMTPVTIEMRTIPVTSIATMIPPVVVGNGIVVFPRHHLRRDGPHHHHSRRYHHHQQEGIRHTVWIRTAHIHHLLHIALGTKVAVDVVVVVAVDDFNPVVVVVEEDVGTTIVTRVVAGVVTTTRSTNRVDGNVPATMTIIVGDDIEL
jgi:hypothetical protein